MVEDYFIFRLGGQIVCGLQVKEQTWTIKRLPGIGGETALKAIGQIPGFGRFFGRDGFKFLRIGNIFIREGFENRFPALLSAVLKRKGYSSAMFFLDKRSSVYRKIVGQKVFGVINLLSETEVRVMALLKDFDHDEIKLIKEKPLLISIQDI